MKIYSTFKDYYDCFQTYEDDLIYYREVREEPCWVGRGCDERSWPCYTFIVGFCGKVYPGLGMRNEYDDGKTWDCTITPTFTYCYSLADVDEFFKKRMIPRRYELYLNHNQERKRYGRRFWSRGGYQDANEYGLKRWAFQQYFELPVDLTKYPFFGHDPIFLIRGKRYEYCDIDRDKLIHYNIRLKNVGFYKVFPNYMAWQELEMFMSNIARPLKPIPDIPDKIMAEAKGFNKFSFRKDKQK